MNRLAGPEWPSFSWQRGRAADCLYAAQGGGLRCNRVAEGTFYDPTHSQRRHHRHQGHTHSTTPWFHFPVGTPMERITVATAPVISVDERQRLGLIRTEQRR